MDTPRACDLDQQLEDLLRSLASLAFEQQEEGVVWHPTFQHTVAVTLIVATGALLLPRDVHVALAFLNFR